jgi:hypothetical protein
MDNGPLTGHSSTETVALHHNNNNNRKKNLQSSANHKDIKTTELRFSFRKKYLWNERLRHHAEYEVCIYIVFHNCFLRRVAYIHSTYQSQSIILNKICSGLQSQLFEIYGLRRDKNFLMLIFCFLSELSFSSNS